MEERNIINKMSRVGILGNFALAAFKLIAGIAGAALDVYESEPAPPPALIALYRLLLTPHVGGWSPEAIEAQFGIFMLNLEGVFFGRGPVTPV